MWGLKAAISKSIEVSIRTTLPDKPRIKPLIAPCIDPKYGDYQCNNALGLWNSIKAKDTQFTGPQHVGQAIRNNLPRSEMIESCTIAKSGFVNIKLSGEWIAKSLHKMLTNGIDIWAPKLAVKRVVVDFCCPNIC